MKPTTEQVLNTQIAGLQARIEDVELRLYEKEEELAEARYDAAQAHMALARMRAELRRMERGMPPVHPELRNYLKSVLQKSGCLADNSMVSTTTNDEHEKAIQPTPPES